MGGYSKDEIKIHREIVLQTIVSGIQSLIKHCEKLEYVVNGDNIKHCRFFNKLNVDTQWNEKMFEKIKLLWEDEAIQRTWKSSTWIQIIYFDYFMENIDRISQVDYMPTNEDMLRARQHLTGEQTTHFVINKNGWDLIDICGIPKREKWEAIISSKESVSGVIFFVASHEYDEVSTEDQSKTKMEMALFEFRDLMNSEELQYRPRISIFLFLNKIDLLEEKLKNEEESAKFKEIFPNFTEGIESATDCVKEKFVSEHPDKKIYTKFISEINTGLMEDIFEDVRETIFDNNLSVTGVRI